jgi:hypothetical protein
LASLRRAQFRQSQRSAAMAIWLGRIRGRPGGGYNNRARRRGTDLTEEAPRDEASRHRLAITTEWRRSLRGSAQGRPKASPGRGVAWQWLSAKKRPYVRSSRACLNDRDTSDVVYHWQQAGEAPELERAIYERVFTAARPIFTTGEYKAGSCAIHNVSRLMVPLSNDGTNVNMVVFTRIACLNAAHALGNSRPPLLTNSDARKCPIRSLFVWCAFAGKERTRIKFTCWLASIIAPPREVGKRRPPRER